MANNTRSFADPVHGIITFDKRDPLEQLLLDIMDTKAFQRLRKIKQLGTSSLVFPNAVHTRFTHCLGTTYIAREMCNIIKKAGFEDIEQRDITLCAALLHDIGHGPYSHNFEHISQNILKVTKSHEEWGVDIITQDPEISTLLENYKPGFSHKVASFLSMDKKDRDLYPSIISGNLDADRMDYLIRDRHFTGIDGSSFSKRKILNSLDVIKFTDGKLGFAIKADGLPSVEEYLTSRVDMYQQVYNSKRETLYYLSLNNFMEKVGKNKKLLNDPYSPFEKYIKGDMSLENYIKMTDADLDRLVDRFADGDNKELALAAQGVRNRDTYKCFDLSLSISSHPENVDLVKSTFARSKNVHVQNKTLRAYDPQNMPIYVIDHRTNGNVYELSEVSERKIQDHSKRIYRLYAKRDEMNMVQNSLGLFYESLTSTVGAVYLAAQSRQA